MQIACPNCSTTYVLDERLLPPLGAPVQCTRCAHVFTAKPDSAPAAKDASGTQIFGLAGEVAPKADPSGTQIFGGVKAPPAAPADRGAKHTQVFGSAPVVPAVTSAPTAAPAGGAPAAARGTQVFGKVPAVPARATPVLGTVPAAPSLARGTQVFGTVPAAPVPAPARGTQVFGTVPAAPAPVRGTQVFGTVAAAPAPARGTQVFGSTPLVPPAARGTPNNGAVNPRATQVFGGALARPAAAPPLAQPERPKHTPVDPAAGDPHLALTPPNVPATSPDVDPYADDGPLDDGDESPELEEPTQRADAPAIVQLPAELASLTAGAADDPAAELRAKIARRNQTVFALLGVVVLGVAGYLGYRQYLSRRPAVPAEARLSLEHGVLLVRKDDASSLRDAAALFKQLAQTYPSYVDARAYLLVAEALQLDDAQVEIARIETASSLLNAQITQLQQAKSTSDWQNRVNTHIDELEMLKKRSGPLNERVKTLTADVNAALQSLDPPGGEPTPAEQREIARANAVYWGATGREQALLAAEHYHALGGVDGWDAIAMGEYAVNARVTDAIRIQASRAIEELRTREPTFLRAYLLAARLALADHHPEVASGALEAAVTLNPAHELAKSLLSETQH